MPSINNFLKGFSDGLPGMKDYRHASRLYIDDNFKLPEIQQFEKKITKRTKAILICNPSNPTGALYAEKELKLLSKIIKKHNIFLISDEVYREFTYDKTKHISILELKNIKKNSIVIDSTSKRYSMCGARIGAIVSRYINIINTGNIRNTSNTQQK